MAVSIAHTQHCYRFRNVCCFYSQVLPAPFHAHSVAMCCACCFAGLLRVVSAKGVSEEVVLAAGEALAAIAGDIQHFDPSDLLWSTHDTIADCVDARQPSDSKAAAAGDAMQVDGEVPASNPATGASAKSSVQEYLLKELCGVLCVSPKEEVRCAGVVVLVSLLQLCRGSVLIRGELPQLQLTFTGLLGDSNDLTQVRGHSSAEWGRGGQGGQGGPEVLCQAGVHWCLDVDKSAQHSSS